MVTLEQIQALDNRVREAVEMIQRLKVEKVGLKKQLSDSEDKIAELESKTTDFESNNETLQKGIQDVLSHLEEFDNESIQEQSAQEENPASDGSDIVENKTIEDNHPEQQDSFLEPENNLKKEEPAIQESEAVGITEEDQNVEETDTKEQTEISEEATDNLDEKTQEESTDNIDEEITIETEESSAEVKEKKKESLFDFDDNTSDESGLDIF